MLFTKLCKEVHSEKYVLACSQEPIGSEYTEYTVLAALADESEEACLAHREVNVPRP